MFIYIDSAAKYPKQSPFICCDIQNKQNFQNHWGGGVLSVIGACQKHDGREVSIF